MKKIIKTNTTLDNQKLRTRIRNEVLARGVSAITESDRCRKFALRGICQNDFETKHQYMEALAQKINANEFEISKSQLRAMLIQAAERLSMVIKREASSATFNAAMQRELLPMKKDLAQFMRIHYPSMPAQDLINIINHGVNKLIFTNLSSICQLSQGGIDSFFNDIFKSMCRSYHLDND